MTRAHSSDLDDIVTQGSFGRELVGDVYYGGTRLLQNVPIDDWSLTGDYDARIKTTAKARIVYQGDFAESYTPREATDALAAFGQELHLFMVISAGDFVERMRVGVYRIDEVPKAFDRSIMFDGAKLTTGSVVDLDLVDRSDTVDTLSRTLEQPASLTSAWAEIVRISRLQATRTVPDVSIPNSIVYDRNRLDAVQQLAGLLGGRAYMLSDGSIGVSPDKLPTQPEIKLTRGEPAGTIIGDEYSMSSRGIANGVFGDFEDADGKPIHAEAFIADGPLAISGPYGERFVDYPGDQKNFIRTQNAANTAVRNHLAKVSRRGPVEIPVTLVPDPRIEIGDPVSIERDGETIGRVVKYSHPRRGAMQMTVRVGE